MSEPRYPNINPPVDLVPYLSAGLTAWPDTMIEAHALGNLITLVGRVLVDSGITVPNVIIRQIPDFLRPSTNATVTLWCEENSPDRTPHALRGIWTANAGSLQLNHSPWTLADFRTIGFTATIGRSPA
ncbi:hypothetical protein ACTXJR_05985 [Glutamicibacter ardleyensis]|uniref:hypothetical protein n=1 Tax=Glutamicibacter ardleyensis TaxID=225894 RepID=UPI003FD4DB2C